MTSQIRAAVLLLTTMLISSGCGGPDDHRPALYPASGTLLINGKPAGGARIVFHPASGIDFDPRGSRPTADVNDDGTFQVKTYQKGDGMPVGDFHVSIFWFGNPDSSNSWDKLGGNYANPQSSGLKVTIKEGSNELAPMELTGVKLVGRPARNPNDRDQVD